MFLYNFKKIQDKWKKEWLKNKIYEPNFKTAKRPFFNLMMFPYPSAEGLHVGNAYAFIGSDIFGRFKRMNGFDVFEPIGLDGFGIHSENYSLKIGAHPMTQSKISEKRFYKQLEMIGNGFAWDERLETYSPDYYKWTQWIFLQMWKNGLANRKKQEVNWCPSCKTVLADEQVAQKSKIQNEQNSNTEKIDVCERCETPVIRKELEQWFFKITDYAEKLLKNIDKLDWSERVKIAQRNWIGKSEGATINFQLKSFYQNDFIDLSIITNNKQQKENFIDVFTTRPDTLFGATYLVLSPEHELLKNNELGIKNYEEVKKYISKARKKSERKRINESGEKTGIELRGVKAINPANKKEIPIWVADYVLSSYGTGAIMAVPAHDERDLLFAKTYHLPVIEVVRRGDAQSNQKSKIKNKNENENLKFKIGYDTYDGIGQLINSGKFNGMDSEKAKDEITKFVGGKKKIQYRLRDWLVSRQRYWGAPIPIIYCRKCWEILNSKSEILNKSKIQNSKLRKGIDYAVFEGKEYSIHSVPEKDLPVKLPFVEKFKPIGTGKSPLASAKPFYEVKCPKCGAIAKRETDVCDTFFDSSWYYIGYLISKNQNSKSKIENCLPTGDVPKGQKLKIENSPFSSSVIRKWCPVSMYIGGAEHSVLHLLYSRFVSIALHDLGFLDFDEPFSIFRAHGLLIKEGAKMSKSKGNVVNPDGYIDKFGIDALRMYLMFLGPFEEGGDWRDSGIMGVIRFLNRVWNIGQKEFSKKQKIVSDWMNLSIKKITDDISSLHYNTSISELMIILNKMESQNSVSQKDFEAFLLMLAPFAPFMTEELWKEMGNKKSIHISEWPSYDKKKLVSKRVDIIVQINGKTRGTINAPVGTLEKEISILVKKDEKLSSYVSGEIKRMIFVKDKIVNFLI